MMASCHIGNWAKVIALIILLLLSHDTLEVTRQSFVIYRWVIVSPSKTVKMTIQSQATQTRPPHSWRALMKTASRCRGWMWVKLFSSIDSRRIIWEVPVSKWLRPSSHWKSQQWYLSPKEWRAMQTWHSWSLILPINQVARRRDSALSLITLRNKSRQIASWQLTKQKHESR